MTDLRTEATELSQLARNEAIKLQALFWTNLAVITAAIAGIFPYLKLLVASFRSIAPARASLIEAQAPVIRVITKLPFFEVAAGAIVAFALSWVFYQIGQTLIRGLK